MEGTKELATQIVLKAVEDWRLLVKSKAWDVPYKRSTYGPVPNKDCNFTEIRNFFQSQYAEELLSICDVNISPREILQKLEKELEEAMRSEHTAPVRQRKEKTK